MKLTQYLAESKISQTALGEMLGVTQSAISQWLDKETGEYIVPPEHCPKIERISNGKVRCEEINEKVDWAFLRATVANQQTKRGGRQPPNTNSLKSKQV